VNQFEETAAQKRQILLPHSFGRAVYFR